MKHSFLWAPVLSASLLAAGACANATVADDDAGAPEVDSSTKDASMPYKDGAGSDTSVADSSQGDSAIVEAGPDGGGLAVVQINEVNPNLASDLVELYVTAGGSTKGITVEENITGAVVLATLPDIPAATGDFIVIHLTPAAGVTDETGTKTDCANAACYSGAWDVKGAVTGITYSARVLVAKDPSSTIQDGVAFWRKGVADPAGFYLDVQALQKANAWLPSDCGGSLCSTNALAQTVSFDWALCGTVASGNSAARITNGDTMKATDWKVGASSLGATNP